MSPESGGQPLEPQEQALLTAFIAAAAVIGALLATGHLSALLFEGGWPDYPSREIPGLLGRLVTHPLDPGSAWDPINEGTQTPGPAAWWFTFFLLAAIVVVPVVLLLRSAEMGPTRSRPVRDRGRSAPVGGIAAVGPRDLDRLGLAYKDDRQIVVGTAGGQDVAIPRGHSLLVLGPSRSGRTSALAVPAVLTWPGPVVATSTAGELVEHTIGSRSRKGDVHVYDPVATTTYRASGWSPLATCNSWQGATRTAWDLAMAGKAATGPSVGVGELWFSSAARSLAPYLFAAAESGRTMADVARWIDGEERDEVLAELRTVHEPDATVAHSATFRRDEAGRASLFHVMRIIVGAYLDPVVAASALRHEIECDELLDGGPHTLFLAAPHHDQARVRPLFSALVRQVVGAVHSHVERTRKPLQAPLLLLLDDAADIAPVEDLPTLAATGAAAGIQLVTVFEDLAQIQVRHGEDMPAVVRNHPAKLLLPGGAVDTIGLATRVSDNAIDETAVTAVAASEGVTADLTRKLPRGEAILLEGKAAPVRVQLKPWHEDRELRRIAGVTQDALAPAASDGDDQLPPPPFDPLPYDPRGPISNPVPGSQPTGENPHLPSNVSALDAARNRLRRRRTPSEDM